jgi:hypothetical protein
MIAKFLLAGEGEQNPGVHPGYSPLPYHSGNVRFGSETDLLGASHRFAPEADILTDVHYDQWSACKEVQPHEAAP